MAKKVEDKKAIIARIAKEHGAKEVYENSKGEFFTVKNYALLSEGNKADKIKTHKIE